MKKQSRIICVTTAWKLLPNMAHRDVQSEQYRKKCYIHPATLIDLRTEEIVEESVNVSERTPQPSNATYILQDISELGTKSGEVILSNYRLNTTLTKSMKNQPKLSV